MTTCTVCTAEPMATTSMLESEDFESCGSESEVDVPPPFKTRKLDGAAKYHTKYNPDWKKKWPCIQKAIKW